MRVDQPNYPELFFSDKAAQDFPFLFRVTAGIKNYAFAALVVHEIGVFRKRIEFENLYLGHSRAILRKMV